MAAAKRKPSSITQESLEELVENLENRALNVLNRDNYGLETLSEDIYKLRDDKIYVDMMKDMVSGFIVNKEDFKEDFRGKGKVTQEELDLFTEFVGVFSHRLYLGQKRKSEKPYFLHSCRINQVNAETLIGKKISYISTCASFMHDIFEEQKINTESMNFKDIAKGLQISLELYNFVKNDSNGFTNKSYFYRGIDSITKQALVLTKPDSVDHITYLHKLCYLKEKDISEPQAFLKTLLEIFNPFRIDYDQAISKCCEKMNPFFNVKDSRELLKEYIMEVHKIHQNSLSNPILRKKHIRRSLVTKNGDNYSNLEDLRETYDISTRAYRFFKGFILCYATDEKFTLQEQAERSEYDKIMPLAKRSIDKLVEESKKDVILLESMLDNKVVYEINNDLNEYKKTKNYHKLTTKEKDNSIFAETFRRYLRMLVHRDEREQGLYDIKQMYVDMLLLNSKFQDLQFKYDANSKFKEKYGDASVKREQVIGGFSLYNLTKIMKYIKNE